MRQRDDRLGRIGVDIITGFTGVITSKIEYQTNCDQLHLQPRVTKKNGQQELAEGKWFDETRVKVTGKAVKLLDVESKAGVTGAPGCDLNIARPSLS